MKIVFLSAFTFINCISVYSQKTDKEYIEFEKEFPPLEILSKSRTVKVITTCDYVSNNVINKIAYTVIGSETEPMVIVPGYTQDKLAKDSIKVIFSHLDFVENDYLQLAAKLSVTDDKGEVLFNGDVPTDNVRVTFTGGSVLDGKQKKANKIEVPAKQKTINALNEFLRKYYGINNTLLKLSYFDIKDKKHTYPEYHEAMQKVKTAYPLSKSDPQKFETLLKEAAGFWETAVKETDKANKEARINKEIAAVTYLNLAQTYTWLNEFEKAKNAFNDYAKMDEDYSNAETRMRTTSEDYAKRYQNWNK